MTFQYFPPTVEGDRITVSPPSAVEVQGAEIWKDCLVGHFVDKKIPFLAVRSVAFKRWAVLSMVLLMFFLMIKYWTAEGLSYLASSVGKPLYADEMTETAKRISYAKICVEVDINASLPHSVDLLMSTGRTVSIAVKYPWRPVKCGACGGESVPTPLEVSELVVTTVVPALRELPCSNQFEALQVMDSSVADTSEGVIGLKAAAKPLDFGDLVFKDSLGSDFLGSDPTSSKGGKVDQNGTLPDVLGVGMEDPDALF
ncbi:hypothetical protein RHMOL_Rhmol04G0267000 [Rhododendron molle]|uniref:Uncharacterized protein n=1 Tax=Rhododendron molle TaxID=49168 RepID=A0ACC0P742_RHOML|nr:hypothetical protein RHMOL_Rhmol04G0267000 [Rhododendron molle]